MGWGNKYARAYVNPSSPRAFSSCDICGINWNLYRLQWQFQFNGTGLYNKRLLVCPTCYDKPSAFLLTPIIPPDPKPVLNARPEPYSVDEEGPIQNFIATMTYDDLTPLVAYLDLYDASPIQDGESVLADLTGTATRTNWGSSFGPSVDGMTSNTSAITFTTDAETSALVWYVVAFDAATDGNILAYAPISAPQTVVMGNGCGFAIDNLHLITNLATVMVTEGGVTMITEGGEVMVTE